MIPPSDLVAIPPVLRTVIYYGIAFAIIVCSAVNSGATAWNLAEDIAQGLAILFFGTAAAKVASTKRKPRAAKADPAATLEPLPSDGGV